MLGTKSINNFKGVFSSQFSNADIADKANIAGPLTPLCVKRNGPENSYPLSPTSLNFTFSKLTPAKSFTHFSAVKNEVNVAFKEVILCPNF